MKELAPQVTQFLSLLTITGQIIIFGLVVLLVLVKFKRIKPPRLLEQIGEKNIVFSLVVATLAMLGSLYYSEIALYEPCKLCWYQRILMYPQVLLLGLALYKKDKSIIPYSLALSGVGALIAGVHYYEQITFNPLIPCQVIGYAASCTERFIMTFGYITIPMMSLTAFLMIIMFHVTNILNPRATNPILTRVKDFLSRK